MKAVVLASTPSSMRLAVAGFDDAIELRRYGVNWFDENSEPVQFGFVQRAEGRGFESPAPLRARTAHQS